MAQYFGQGATYDSIQGRFREYRKVAAKMQSGGSPHTAGGGSGRDSASNPATPRSSTRNGVTKSSAKRRTHAAGARDPVTPSKKGKGKSKNGSSVMESILLDDDGDGGDDGADLLLK